MLNHGMSNDISFSLLTIIVNRGKASKILDFAREKGARDVSCFLGKGTMKNNLLQFIEMNEVAKEILLIVVPSAREAEILDQLNMKFHFERPHHGIAFTMPLAGVLKMKRDNAIKWSNSHLPKNNECEYTVLFLIVDKGKAEGVIQISQDAGCYGGTIIKARGSASKLNTVLDMIVEPEKEAVLMLMESNRANQLAVLLNKQLQLNQANKGLLIKIGVGKTVGLFRDAGNR